MLCFLPVGWVCYRGTYLKKWASGHRAKLHVVQTDHNEHSWEVRLDFPGNIVDSNILFGNDSERGAAYLMGWADAYVMHDTFDKEVAVG